MVMVVHLFSCLFLLSSRNAEEDATAKENGATYHRASKGAQRFAPEETTVAKVSTAHEEIGVGRYVIYI